MNAEQTQGKSHIAWLWMCKQPAFNSIELATACGLVSRKAKSLAQKWCESGHLIRDGRGTRNDPFRYRVRDVNSVPVIGKGRVAGQKKRRIWKKTSQQKMWNTMKIAGRFSIRDLIMTASIGEGTAQNYISKLLKAGYITVVAKVDQSLPVRERKGLRGCYRLIRNTGRLAPMVRDDGCWDQNQQVLYPNQNEGSSHEQNVA